VIIPAVAIIGAAAAVGATVIGAAVIVGAANMGVAVEGMACIPGVIQAPFCGCVNAPEFIQAICGDAVAPGVN
jgi:hypothetical protein